MSVRISATDWVEGGIDGDDAVEIARAFKAAGADLIDVSTGQTSPGREARSTAACSRRRTPTGFATRPASRRWRSATSPRPIRSTRSSPPAAPIWSRSGGRILADPFWTLHAAAQLGYADAAWPVQYLPGKEQLERLIARAQEQTHVI